MANIDYEIQFKEIDSATFAECREEFARCTAYYGAEPAFKSAVRREARGIDVAFAKYAGQFWVFAGRPGRR